MAYSSSLLFGASDDAAAPPKKEKKSAKSMKRGNAQMVLKRYAQSRQKLQKGEGKGRRNHLNHTIFTEKTIAELCSNNMRKKYSGVPFYTDADAETPIFTFDAEGFARMDQILAEQRKNASVVEVVRGGQKKKT